MKREIKQHPRNERIAFDKERHEYLFDGETYFEGITGWIGEYAEPFDATRISRKLAAIRGQSPEEILQEWEDARQYGDYVHESAELWVNDGLELNVSEVDLMKDTLKEMGLTPVFSEWVVYDEDVQRASAIDLLCVNEDGQYVIVDIKTSKKDIKFNGYRGKTMFYPFNDLPDAKYFKYCLQVNIYQRWLEEKYENVELADTHYILRVRNNLCEPIPVLDMQDKVQLLYEEEMKEAA